MFTAYLLYFLFFSVLGWTLELLYRYSNGHPLVFTPRTHIWYQLYAY